MQKISSCSIHQQHLTKKEARKQSHSKSLKKCLELNQRVKDLYNENCKLLKKEIIKDTRKWKDPMLMNQVN
jgi:hypothetical protein